MSFGIIEYDQNGLPKCEVCNQYFHRVLSHVRQKHAMTAREYKQMFGFDLIKGITSEQSKHKSRDSVLRNYDLSVSQNLLEKGKKSRFDKGCSGRTGEQVSQQTRLMLAERAKNSMTLEKRKQKGKQMGLSGKGNLTRWGSNS